MTTPFYNCPVPIDQRPINEYEELSTSPFFFWTTKSMTSYLKTLATHILLVYAAVVLLIKISITNSELEVNTLAYILTFGNVVLIVGILRIYLGWLYIYERLIKASITYEESGWYDGQTWIKPPESLIQDKLIATYKLLPILNRLKQTLLFFCIISLISLGYLKYCN
jgi:hypothetical protein